MLLAASMVQVDAGARATGWVVTCCIDLGHAACSLLICQAEVMFRCFTSSHSVTAMHTRSPGAARGCRHLSAPPAAALGW